MKTSGRQQGTVLIEMGCISPHNLRYALDLQLRLKLMDVFSWITGEWQFNPRAQPPAGHGAPRAVPGGHHPRGRPAGLRPGAPPRPAGRRLRPGRAPDRGPALRRAGHGARRGGAAAARADGRQPHGGRAARAGPPAAAGHRPASCTRFSPRRWWSCARARRDGAAAQPAPRSPGWRRRHRGARPGGRRRGAARARGRGPDGGRGQRAARAAARDAGRDEADGLLRVARRPPRRSGGGGRAPTAELVREYHLDKFGGSVRGAGAGQQIARSCWPAPATPWWTPAARAEYRDRAALGRRPARGRRGGGPNAQAESTFRRGQQLLAAGDVAGARALFEEAVQLQPEEGEFVAYLGWARFQASPPADEEAQVAARRPGARRRSCSPTLEKAHLFLGYVLKALGPGGGGHRRLRAGAGMQPLQRRGPPGVVHSVLGGPAAEGQESAAGFDFAGPVAC